jgi:hypothetical protein
MALAPLVEVGRAVGLDPARAEHAVLTFVPVLSGAIDPVVGELVDDEERRERGEQVETFVERVHVVQHATSDDGIPFALELLERPLHEARALGRLRVYTEDLVSRGCEQLDDTALVPAPDFEHAQWRRR